MPSSDALCTHWTEALSLFTSARASSAKANGAQHLTLLGVVLVWKLAWSFPTYALWSRLQRLSPVGQADMLENNISSFGVLMHCFPASARNPEESLPIQSLLFNQAFIGFANVCQEPSILLWQPPFRSDVLF